MIRSATEAEVTQEETWRSCGRERRRVSGGTSVGYGTVRDMASRRVLTAQEQDVGPASVGTSVELFTGGGGLAMAMERAGFRHLLCNEFARYACNTLRKNAAVDYKDGADLPTSPDDPWPLIEGDVRQVDFTRLEGKVDVVAGGPPCQPFSLGGIHQGHEDERNMFPEVFRVIRETRPLAVVCENVRGLLRPSFEPYFQYICGNWPRRSSGALTESRGTSMTVASKELRRRIAETQPSVILLIQCRSMPPIMGCRKFASASSSWRLGTI